MHFCWCRDIKSGDLAPFIITRLWRNELGLRKALTNPSNQCPVRYVNRTHQTYAALSRFTCDESAEWKEMSNFCVQFKLRHVKTDRFYWILPTTQWVLCNSNASSRRSDYWNTRGEMAPRPSPLLILYMLMDLVRFCSIIYIPLPARIQRVRRLLFLEST